MQGKSGEFYREFAWWIRRKEYIKGNSLNRGGDGKGE